MARKVATSSAGPTRSSSSRRSSAGIVVSVTSTPRCRRRPAGVGGQAHARRLAAPRGDRDRGRARDARPAGGREPRVRLPARGSNAAALAVPERAAEVVAGLEARIAAVGTRAAGAPRRRCVVLEWIAPPYRSGHWTPELVAIAGGTEPLGRVGEDAARVPWEAVLSAAPEVLVLACCGYDLTRTMADVPLLGARPGWEQLPAVRAGQVYAVDGSAYFSRPGPRLVDSLEMLAEILHPELFAGRLPA